MPAQVQGVAIGLPFSSSSSSSSGSLEHRAVPPHAGLDVRAFRLPSLVLSAEDSL